MTTDSRAGRRPVVYLTRRATFAAAHRLWADELDDAANRALFGPCARDHGHGHNYVIELTLRGGIDPRTGIVVNLTEMRDALQTLILMVLDKGAEIRRALTG